MKVLGPFVAAFALATAVAAAPAARAATLGINYNWWGFTLLSSRECRAEKAPRSTGSWVVPNYDDPAVRATAKKQLRAMHDAGFETLRTILIFDHSSDPDPTAFTSLDGGVAPSDRAKLQAFVRDVSAAGFKTLEIVASFDSENWVFCRDREWGDCFDPRRTDENWRFISQTAQAAIAAAGPLALRFDLGNEQAPDPHMPPRTLARTKIYLQTIARRFAGAYGDRWLISAARSDDSTALETRERLGLLVADLAAANLRPKYLELHSYSDDGNDMVESLDAAQAIAQSIDARVILGELRYHSAVQASAIAGWLRKNPHSRLADLILWPEYDPSLVCGLLPEPPYTPGALHGE